MSMNSEPLRAEAAEYSMCKGGATPAEQSRQTLESDDPIVGSLLIGASDLDTEIEALVRQECQEQGVDLPRETGRWFSYARLMKPCADRLAAAFLLVLLAPLFIPIALAIKLTSAGPVFFVQNRTGYLGRRFALIKFRTMVHNAEELKKELMSHNIFGSNSPDFKLKKDPRITPIGAFLRKTSLDELPNLINVLRGDMSLIGPRPTSFKAATYRKKHLTRLATTPGLTGLWQVSGRADVDFDERADLDVEYIQNVSLKGDVHITCKTIGVVFSRRGAY